MANKSDALSLIMRPRDTLNLAGQRRMEDLIDRHGTAQPEFYIWRIARATIAQAMIKAGNPTFRVSI